jgi:phytoene dehydrogenase-like protein
MVENGVVTGVRLEPRAGEPAREVRARCVLSNADLKMTMERLIGVEHLPASWVTRTRDFQMAGAIFLTFLGVKADLRALGMRKANYWQFDDFDTEGLYGAASNGDLRARASYVTSASLKDPSNALHHAPAGVMSVEVMTLVPGNGSIWGVDAKAAEGWKYGDDTRYRETKLRLEDDMIRRLDAMFPGAAKAVVFRESATPVSHVRYTRATDGTGYGLAATPAQFLKGRPGYRGPLPHLYLCGASTRAGHGIVGAMSSGKNAAKRIAADLGKAATLHATA